MMTSAEQRAQGPDVAEARPMDTLLVKIPRGRGEATRVRWCEHEGHQRLDVRRFFQRDGDTTWHPTRNGDSVPEGAVPDLVGKLYERLDASARARVKELLGAADAAEGRAVR